MADKELLLKQLKVLAEPKRFAILDLLMEGTHCNCEFVKKLQMPPNLISHHLSVLKEAGLVEMQRDEKDARWIYYSVNQQALQELLSDLSDFLDLSRIRARTPACSPTPKPSSSSQCKADKK